MPIVCPAIMSPTEDARVRATIPASSERTDNYTVTGSLEGGLHEGFSPVVSIQQWIPSEEVTLRPGDSFRLSLPLKGVDPKTNNYLIVKIHAQAGEFRGYPDTLREIAYEGRCGIAILDFIGLRGSHILILVMGVHLLGSILFFQFTSQRTVGNTALMINLKLMAGFATLVPIAALVPIPQNILLGQIVGPMYLLFLLLVLLIIGFLIFSLLQRFVLGLRGDPPPTQE